MAPKYISKLQAERILILGGTSGIGYSVAEAALEHGATVFIAGSTQTKVDKKISELKDSNSDAKERIFGKACNLANLEDQEANIVALLDFATDNKTNKLDHIINSTGDGPINPPFSDLTTEIILKAQIVRVFAPLMLAKHAKTYLNDSHRSSFTLTSGAGSYKPRPGWTLLPIIGGTIDGMVRSLAINLAPIRVNAVAPGPVLTELWGGGEKVSKEKAKAIDESVKDRSLTGHIGLPEEVAETYLYLMKNRNVTGTMNMSDGGMLLKQ